MNYHNLIIEELNQQRLSQIEYLKDCEDDENENILISITAIEISINYFNIRFDNNLKHYNNDEERAYDLHSAKKALEYFNIYVEEIYFIGKEKTQNRFTFRKELRNIINVLHNVVNNN